mmetsp:Transcript_31104/g.103624  ORF Transcript_31104/g.103624 Transcript_31104/m.103624 type:complete len:212 (-) Transcript_31104:433-1068(-)
MKPLRQAREQLELARRTSGGPGWRRSSDSGQRMLPMAVLLLLLELQRGGAGEVLTLHEADGPGVPRAVLVADEVVGHVEVALVSPVRTPRVAHDEPLLLVVVAHGQDGMSTLALLPFLGHGHDASGAHRRGEEGLEDRKAEGEGETLGDASLHVLQSLRHASVLLTLVVQRELVVILRRFLREHVDVVGPQGLQADAQLLRGLDAVADRGA